MNGAAINLGTHNPKLLFLFVQVGTVSIRQSKNTVLFKMSTKCTEVEKSNTVQGHMQKQQ